MKNTMLDTIREAGRKLIWVRVGYGKNQKYISTDWVAEDALEAYKADWMDIIRNEYGWKKDVTFFVKNTTVVSETGIMSAYVKRG